MRELTETEVVEINGGETGKGRDSMDTAAEIIGGLIGGVAGAIAGWLGCGK
ncbi:hypothetical protein [Pedobacter nutrimenti]|nr:hypothetical protein [Pedobacter nutrimenti]